jgi:hypothetical protein
VGPYARNGRAVWSASSAAEPVATVSAAHDRCRAGRTLRTYGAERLDAIRAALAPACEFRATDGSGLRFQLSCEGPTLFELGVDTLDPAFERGVPRGAACASVRGWPIPSRLGCAGEILAANGGVRALRVAVVGAVDRSQLVREQAGCSDLPAPFGAHPAARATFRRGDPDWVAANDRLAYCRAARVAHAIQQGITAPFRAQALSDGAPPRQVESAISVLGASDVFFASRPECAAAERGKCDAARRVEVLLEVVPEAAERLSRCSETVDGAATALFCLQECVADASAELRSSAPWSPPTDALAPVDLREAPCWHYATTHAGRARPAWLSPASMLETLGLDATPRCTPPTLPITPRVTP